MQGQYIAQAEKEEHMKVSIKDLQVSMDLGNNGIELDVYNGTTHLGDLRIGKATIEWCKGKKPTGNGVKKDWKQLIAWFEENPPNR
jgi:hypothetical protein